MSNVRPVLLVLAVALFFASSSHTQQSNTNFFNYEAALTSPIRISPDGTRLFAVNNPNATLSVFNIGGSNASTPSLVAEIPVGLEPVSVNPRTNDEVWIVNQASDSVSVVSVSKGIITDTLSVVDEPSDVVFAGQNAFVSAARNNSIYVFNVSTHALTSKIGIFGGGPRALAVSSDGSKVYAAMALSGNQTTAIPFQIAPPPPPPVNPALPPAPQQDIIVKYNDPAWSSFVTWTMPDNDVAIIDASSLKVSQYVSDVGTINKAIAVQPSTGDLFVANTDLLNTVRFQTALLGHFANHRVSKITTSGAVTAYDLNAGFTYTNFPNQSEISQALADPTALVFDSTGQKLYVACFGTDRVAEINSTGSVLARIEIDPSAVGPALDTANKRGPRGLAINYTGNALYVLNRISNTISVVNTSTNTVTSEFPIGTKNPTPSTITNGRGFLYDAKLSGSGTGACATCHVDGESDHLSWDLGDPTGSMATVTLQDGSTAQVHPMKGPMFTITLRGLLNEQPYHWRGDRANFAAFNEAFQVLMGGNQLTTDQMTAYTNFINTILYMPNPYQNLDRTLPTSLILPNIGTQGRAVGNAQNGQALFSTTIINRQQQTCATCHTLNAFGSNLAILQLAGEPQVLKVPELRTEYQKQLFTTSGPTIDGFGIGSEGDVNGIVPFVGDAAAFPGLSGKSQEQFDIDAFVLSFDTGTAPAVGFAETLTKSNVSTRPFSTNWGTLESQAAAGNCDLVANGTVNGNVTGLIYSPAAGTYTSIDSGQTLTHAQLLVLIKAGDTLTFMGVPPASAGIYAK